MARTPITEIIGTSTAGAEMIAGGAYEGADRFDRQLATWAPPIRSADADLLADKSILDARVREMSQNDSYVLSGSMLHKNAIVGAAYLLNSKPKHKVLGLDEEWAAEFQEEVETKFTLAMESPNHWVDAERSKTFTDIVRMAVSQDLLTGEFLAVDEWAGRKGRPFGTSVHVIDTDRLSNPHGQMDTKRLRRGVHKDPTGVYPIGVWVQDSHPSDVGFYSSNQNWTYLSNYRPWGRQRVLHIFEQQRPAQSRGVSTLVAALKEMRMTRKFRDITLQNAVVNATYAATIESEFPEQAFAALGGGNVGKFIEEYGTGLLGAVAKYSGNSRNTYLDGAKVAHLFPGTKLQMRPAGTPGGVGTDFEKSLVRYIANILGVSYEQLSKDFSETNYSSARAGFAETEKAMLARKRLCADKVANFIYRLWLEEAIESGDITSMPKNHPAWRDGINAEAYSSAEWLGAAMGQIDELKETQAAVLRLKYNISTLEQETGRLGRDWRQQLKQRQREHKLSDDLGIPAIEEAQSIKAVSGSPQERQPVGEPSTGEGRTEEGVETD